METINDIVAEMRELAKEVRGYPLENSWELLMGLTNRIEQVAKYLEDDRDNRRKQALAEDERANATQPVTNCNGFKMRKAIEQIREELLRDSGCGPVTEFHIAVDKITQEALSAPPRNCDLYEKEDDAFQEAKTLLEQIHSAYSDRQGDISIYPLRKVIKAVNEALAKPLRNCDVGTAEEQSVRMAKFCSEQFKKTDGTALCSGCQFHYMEGLDCQFAWAQMPYESEVKNENGV